MKMCSKKAFGKKKPVSIWEGNVEIIDLIFYELILHEVLRKNLPNIFFIIYTINNTKISLRGTIKY